MRITTPITVTGLLLSAVLLSACSGKSTSNDTVKVYRSDGSLQCEGGGITPETMRATLESAGIAVQCAQAGHDGNMHITVCGSPTGNINVFTIEKRQAEGARIIGFAPVSELSGYQDEPCGT